MADKRYVAGFIGIGNMGGTLASVCAKAVGGASVAVSNHSPEKAAAFVRDYGCAVLTNSEIAEKCDYVFLGVKPQMLPGVLTDISEGLKKNSNPTVVSMAAAVTSETIREGLGGYKGKLIRIMPNMPAKVYEGMTLCSYSDDMTDDAKAAFTAILNGAGEFEELPEKLIDAGSAVSGCGPAFVYMFIEALADAGVECGLPRAKAQKLAAQTVIGAGKSVLAFGNPGSLKDAVCSPGGTTIAGVHALEERGFRGTAMDAVVASYKRTLELK
ncbi:MAG: pyrroline-5-carboxylate reductase [Clostridia bacterium]|nr:pyrroline-5-carboxylate reductase [Clostridia bacterium]